LTAKEPVRGTIRSPHIRAAHHTVKFRKTKREIL